MRFVQLAVALVFAGLFAACEQADFSANEKDEAKDTPTDSIDYRSGAFTVEQAVEYYSEQSACDTLCWVRGYIVGVVEGTTLAKANFSASTEKTTNILLADSPDEDDYDFCLPVELKSGTVLRQQLNLADNPTNYQRQIALKAHLTTYFRVAGMKKSLAYHWLSDSKKDTVDVEL